MTQSRSEATIRTFPHLIEWRQMTAYLDGGLSVWGMGKQNGTRFTRGTKKIVAPIPQL